MENPVPASRPNLTLFAWAVALGAALLAREMGGRALAQTSAALVVGESRETLEQFFE
jgi:hypothetical protein